jgi:hypothetical protein
MEPIPAVLGLPGTATYDNLGAVCLGDPASLVTRFGGRCPVIAHPPRHAFGRVNPSGRSSPRDRALTLWMLEQVRSWGGVLEHPAHSRLWTEAALPAVGDGRDPFGGWTLPVWQSWWGCSRPRPTWLYVVGYEQPHMPAMPLALASHPTPDADADHGPLAPAFAAWLVQLATTIGHAQAWRYSDRGGR